VCENQIAVNLDSFSHTSKNDRGMGNENCTIPSGLPA
jgi:hypothetical protein